MIKIVLNRESTGKTSRITIVINCNCVSDSSFFNISIFFLQNIICLEKNHFPLKTKYPGLESDYYVPTPKEYFQ